ncbi:hypothetical protein SFR_2294 [Streptomyces sp. FR-008]|nr:hypothetical protein SFR_2294 [Streptomyces sp. FR-008]
MLSCNCTPSRSRTSARSVTGSSPSTETEPESGLRSPATLSTVVVFPAPLGPMIPKISPSSTQKETS